MFRSWVSALKFIPYNGMKVIITADVQVYEKDGQYQLYAVQIIPDGLGGLYLAYEQLKERLGEEGLFDLDLKKPLPAFPQRIAAVTAPGGAALQDILNILSRRYKLAEIWVFPCLVQGENAVGSILSALKKADDSDADIIILGRGGGSFEDLSAFNSEELARGIYACKTPVISAVGHETDITVADLTADLRAPTPSAAAELAVPDTKIVYDALSGLGQRLERGLLSFIEMKKSLLSEKEKSLSAASPKHRLSLNVHLAAAKSKSLETAFSRYIEKRSAALDSAAALLESLNPFGVMERGYAAVSKDGAIIVSQKELSAGDEITVRFSDGEVKARVISV